MKNKALKLGIILFVGIITFSGCTKKGEDDPFLSLRTRTARLTGEWNVVTYDSKSLGGSTTIIEKIDGSSYTETYITNGQGRTYIGTATHTITIEKDGTYENIFNSTSTADGRTYIDNYKEKGVWYWAEGNKELKTKSKELVVFQTTEVTSFNGYDNTVSYYEGPACPLSYMQITQLKNKKMVIEMEGKRTSGTGDATTYESSATYEKE